MRRQMTPDELEAAVLAGDTHRVIGLLAGASEPERLACGARMLRLRREHGDWLFNNPELPVNEATLVALLGTGTAGQIAAGRRMSRHDAAATVLRLRPTALLVELVPWILDRLGWPFVRALVREGTIPRPASDAYIYGMLDYSIDATKLLREDPDLLDHEVWRLFEVEGTGDHSLADHDKYTHETKTWMRVLLALQPERIDRDRLLDSSLAALERDLPAFRAGWYSRFHEALAPTPAERAARVDAYLRLLRSPIPPTVTLAVGALTQVQRAGALDGARLLAHIEPAMTARAAGTARDALGLVARAVRQEPSLSRAAARPVVGALAHASPDVQRAAVALLETELAPLDDETATLLDGRRGDVAASVRPRLEALLVGRPAAIEEVTIPRRVADEAESLARTTSTMEHPDPYGALVPLEPVGSLAELVELLARVLEREGPPEDLELALDGVLRFSGPRPAEFVRLTHALRVRSERLLAGRRAPGIATWFAALIRSWVDGTPPADDLPPSATLAGYLARRVTEVARAACGARPGALVALPSYVGGWIEPDDLVARLAARQREPVATHGDTPLDVTQALLRVLPVRREPALASATELRGEVGEAVRHALGGPARVGSTAALWAAAARCRAPDRDDAEVARVHPGLGPDTALAGRYMLVIGDGRWSLPRLEGGMPAAEPRHDIATDLLWRTSAHAAGPGDERPLVDWMRLIWPQDRRSWFAVSAALLLGNLDWWAARWHDRQRLEALFEPWTPIGREGAMLLAVGLQAKEPGERGLAVDAAATACEEGRLSADLLVGGFDEVAAALEPQTRSNYPITLFRPGRLARSLDAIARRSDQHRAWALEVGAGALARIMATERPEPVPAGQVTPLLRLLVELTTAVPSRTPPIAGPALRSLSVGSGEAARLARALLDGTRAGDA
jgi:hypothetical protein